ncbi:MAG: methylmalonyl-CoA mutase family protein [Deltaproteobacteria bacterium]
MAGTQSLHTNAFDEALSIPTPRSEKLALRTQQIIAFESGATSTADPLGGSYYVESLTNEMEAECYRYLETIEKLGGVIAAVETGFFQREIARSAFRYQQAIENKERIVVGLNEFRDDEGEYEIELRENSPEFEARKIAALGAFKRGRDQDEVRSHIEAIRRSCGSDENVMPVLIAAVKAGVTLGEAISAMREVFGRYREEALF